MGRRNGKGISLGYNTTIREQNTGVKQVDVGSVLKTHHLQRLAGWASKYAKIAPLAAFFGERLAAEAEASGIHVQTSTLTCQRCETILQPGINCTIRIEKNTSRKRKLKKSETPRQNNVVYTCHFCFHPNLKWGTSKGHVKGLVVSRQVHNSISKSHFVNNETEANSTNAVSNIEFQYEVPEQTHVMEFLPKLTSNTLEKATAASAIGFKSQATPLMSLNSKSKKKKKRKVSGSTADKAPVDSSATIADSGKAAVGSSKRRRKGWISLKKMVESSDSNKFSIPFCL